MPSQYNKLIRRPPFSGLDLTSSDLSRQSSSASNGKNFIYTKDGTLAKAPGFVCASNVISALTNEPALAISYENELKRGIYGLAVRNNSNKYRSGFDFQDQELVVISNILFRVKKKFFTLRYLLPVVLTDVPWYSFLFDTTSNTYKFTLNLSGTVVGSVNCGDPLSNFVLTISQLETQLAAVDPNWSVDNTLGTNDLATCIPITTRSELSFEYSSWLVANVPVYVFERIPTHATVNGGLTTDNQQFVQCSSSILLQATDGEIFPYFDSFNFESTQRQSRLYLAGNANPLGVYDGIRSGAAGASNNYENSGPAVALIAGPGITAASGVKYKYSYEYVGYDGQIYETELTNVSGTLTPANQKITVTQPAVNYFPFVQSYPDGVGGIATAPLGFIGYKTTTVGVGVTTLTVTANNTSVAHDIQVGESVYIGTDATPHLVTATTPTTITISPSVTTTASPTSVSRVACKIWRTKDGGTDYYYLTKTAVGVDTTTYTDSTTDANLGAVWVQRDMGFGYPVSHVCLHQDKVVTATGIRKYKQTRVGVGVGQEILDGANTLTVFFSTNSGAEYFNISNSFSLPTDAGNFITGLVSDNDRLLIFTDTSVYVVSGTLGLGNFSVKPLYRDIGCIAPNSIRVLNGIIIFLSNKGICALESGNLERIGLPVDKNILENAKIIYNPESVYLNRYNKNLAYATAGIDPVNQWYFIYIPNLRFKNDGIGAYATHIRKFTTDSQNGTIFIYDFKHKAWYSWDNINAQGGFAWFDNRVWFASRNRSKNDEGFYESRLHYVVPELLPEYCIAHNAPIKFSYTTSWEDAGDNRVFKMFPELRVDTVDALNNTQNFLLSVEVEKDYQAGAPTQQFTMNFNDAGGYGETPYGQTEYGSPEYASRLQSITNQKAKSIRLIFKNENIAENVQISGWELDVASQFVNTKKE